MKHTRLGICLVALAFLVVQILGAGNKTDEEFGRAYMRLLNRYLCKEVTNVVQAEWNYLTNITKHNKDMKIEAGKKWRNILNEYSNQIKEIKWQQYRDPDLKQLFLIYSSVHTNVPEELSSRLISTIANMKNNYAKATVCDYKNRTKCDLHFEDLKTILKTSEDTVELKYYWLQWHKEAGAPSRGNFTEYVTLKNEFARNRGQKNAVVTWQQQYAASDIEDQLINLWITIKPLYQQLHAYLRHKLRLKYGEALISARGPIPSHLLGKTHNLKLMKPFPDKADFGIDGSLIAQNYTVERMFKTAEEFFTSLGLSAMPDSFWENSIFENPNDGRDIDCQPSAHNFYNGEARIRMCATVTGRYFKIVHHEMGHIQYYLQYKDQPLVYQLGPNPGFHEAIGDTIALSVMTPKHLRVLGLLDNGNNDIETNINQLFEMSLQKLFSISTDYLYEIFRYGVFRGITTDQDYTCHFWKLWESIGGSEPAAPRTENDFDVAAVYHVSADIELMRYFVSDVIQFQFHRSLCQLAGEYSPSNSSQLLSNCDIYNSKQAGNALKKMLQLGASKPWPDALESLTGTRNMDASAIMEYFKPLYDWLKAENARTGEYIGWEPSTIQYCTDEQKSAMETSEFYLRLKKYASRYWHDMGINTEQRNLLPVEIACVRRPRSIEYVLDCVSESAAVHQSSFVNVVQ